jgi:putative PEP-CTERM system histidine kinase
VTSNISLITHGIAATAYVGLCGLLLTQWRVKPLGTSLLFAAGATAAWGLIIALGTLSPYPPVWLMQLAELARNSGWLFVLLQLLSLQDSGERWVWLERRWRPMFAGAVIAALLIVSLRPIARFLPPLGAANATDLSLTLWLLSAVTGLILIEQLYRNAREEERWGIKFLCLGVGTLFAYDFFMYAEALLFRALNAQLWQGRGIVAALIVPWLMISIGRNRNWRMEIHVSRHVVFHTVTLLGAGLYLLGMAVAGYFLKYLGGTWSGVLQISFLAASGALLGTLLFSGTLRARLRVFLSKHFFSYRYDYRVEWLRFTEGLAAVSDVPAGIVSQMAPIAMSPGGFVLYRDDKGRLVSTASWELDLPSIEDLGNLPDWIMNKGWVIDLDEWRHSPDLYEDLELPGWLRTSGRLWLVVPLLFRDGLEGLLFLARTDLKSNVNWEDRDLLKTAGRQAAALHAQQRANAALIEARQFDAFNRLSAYVIHDLKNILAQQSLMVANARKHRDNPAFIEDMISTVENSVKRMQRLMEQMRSGLREAAPSPVDLKAVLEKVAAARSAARPSPRLQLDTMRAVTVVADSERLSTVFGHLVQNAQEATPDDGDVTIHLSTDTGLARILIRDTGCGMSEAFVRDKLFRPFESTKGLTGMGIGVFESREYVRQLGGDIRVESEQGAGSCFTITIPLTAPDETWAPKCDGGTHESAHGVAD